MKVVFSLLGAALLVACQSSPVKSAGNQAHATLEPRSNSSVKGNVDFFESGSKVRVTAKVSGLMPGSQHGFHVHEKGDCSSPDAMSAGGHFNPDGNPHSNPGSEKRHAGDMNNLTADSKGEATASFEFDTIRIDEGKYGILNRAVVIHAQPDDYASQPAGNAGGRIACGVIRKS